MNPRSHRTRRKRLFVLTMLSATALWGVIVIYSAQLQFCSSNIDIASYLPGGLHEDPDVVRVNAELDTFFTNALIEAISSPPADQFHQRQLLGTLLLFDKTLSVYKNLACTSCHDPAAGFTGGSSLFNQTIVAYPGTVPITNASPGEPNYRLSARKPQSYNYAPFAPILHYNATQGDFYGGNFWDMRATGTRLGNCDAEQAEGPFTNPLEHGFADLACAVFRVSQSPYRAFFEEVWGPQSFAVTWPANIEQVCSTPGPPPSNDPLPVHLSAVDRGIVSDTYDHMALSIAQYDTTQDVSPFSSKFDFALAHPDQHILSIKEQAGWSLFRGKALCNTFHLDGTSNRSKGQPPLGPNLIRPGMATDRGPLFTDF